MRSYCPVFLEVWLPLLPRNNCKFRYFLIFFCIAATIKRHFLCVGNSLSLTYLSVVPKFYSSSIPLNKVWPPLTPKYFGKLFDIYQLDIVRLHLWKIGVCSSWGELRSHYPIFLGVWLPFLPKILVSFVIFEIPFHVAAITKNLFLCRKWSKSGAPFRSSKIL